jgi:uracil-DNA glycosylase
MVQFKTLIKDIKTNWKPILLNIYKEHKTEFENMEEKIEESYQKYDEYYETFPPKELIFNAFNLFDFKDLKVVIIGQDPYHGQGQAMGLSFSVPKGIKVPPSLNNIYKELKQEYEDDFQIPKHGDLSEWGKQGVLLLNASLTVREKNANSHEPYWRKTQFMEEVIKYISKNHNSIIFLLWGGFAKGKKKFIDENKHYILEAVHPSPLSAKNWFGNGHFQKTNEYLKEIYEDIINWQV